MLCETMLHDMKTGHKTHSSANAIAVQPGLDDIRAAQENLAGRIVRTPLVESDLPLAHSRKLFHKLELCQNTGAFKLRGATNAILNLPPEARERGVVTVSTGNHGRAVSYAARKEGLPAVVCMSRLVPQNKVAAIRALGADVRIHGDSQDEAAEEAEKLVTNKGMTLIPPFDHPDVMAGQGTIGLEILEDLPDVETILIPLSGGGLAGGIAIAVKAVNPDITIIGISTRQCPAMYESVKAGRPVNVPEHESLADSLGGGIGLSNRFSFPAVRELVDDIILLDENQIKAGMQALYHDDRLVTEGAAATGAAALLAYPDRVPGEKVVDIVSGKNVDIDMFTKLMTEGNAHE